MVVALLQWLARLFVYFGPEHSVKKIIKTVSRAVAKYSVKDELHNVKISLRLSNYYYVLGHRF